MGAAHYANGSREDEMPKLAGVSVIGVIAAAVAMFFVGFIFYGMLFSDIYMTSRGVTAADFEGDSPVYMGFGFLIELALAFGLGWLINRLGVTSLNGAIMTGISIAVLIGWPVLAYEFAYNQYHSVPGLLLDWAHLLVTFTVGSALVWVLRAKTP
jgi:hypothetical protein